MSYELHPLNRGGAFEAVEEQTAQLLTESQIEAWNRDGFFVFEGAFEPETLQQVVAEIDPAEARVEQAIREQGGVVSIARADEITFTTHMVLRSSLLADFCRSALLTQLATDLLGPDVRLYWDQAVYKKPGTRAPFPWHQDNGYGYVDPQCYVTCWIALTDATEENGCPWVVPGVHRRGTLAHRRTEIGLVCLDDPEDRVAVPAVAGSIVVFSSLTPHATGPNLTDEVRKAYIVQYAKDGTRRHEVDPKSGEERFVLQDDPKRQFLLSGRG